MLRTSIFCSVLTVTIVAATGLHAQDSAPNPKANFQLTISSAMDMTIEKAEEKLTTETDLKYSWERTAPTQRTLTLQQTGVRVFMNGKPSLNAVMNQHGTANVEAGKTKNVKASEAPEEVRTMLADSYGPPLCVLTVDANGVVTKKEVVAKAGAKNQIDNGMVANCMLFHAPFFADKAEYDRPIEMSMGNGGFATGTLRYTRAKDYDPKHPKLLVKGTATKDKLQPSAANPAMTLRDATYTFSGEQVFNPETGEWTSGTLTMQVAFQLFSEEKNIGHAKGTLICKLSPAE